jgi:lipopolysaccharide biosynthesis glycosyltransferase
MFHGLATHGLPDSVDRVVIGPHHCDFATAISITEDYSDVPVEQRSQFVNTASKLFAFTLKYDRIICIDSDILCVGDCSYLWSDRLGGLPFYAVRDTAAIHWHEEPIIRLRLQESLLFNCGVTIYHPALLPTLHDDILRWIRGGTLFSYDGSDQGYLNQYMQVIQHEIGWLPSEYNCCLDEYMPRIPPHAMRMVHFAGELGKPWNSQFPEDDWRMPRITQWWKEYALLLREKETTRGKIGIEYESLDLYSHPQQATLPPIDVGEHLSADTSIPV